MQLEKIIRRATGCPTHEAQNLADEMSSKQQERLIQSAEDGTARAVIQNIKDELADGVVEEQDTAEPIDPEV